MQDINKKQCTKCKEIKSFNEFYKNKVNQFGLSSYCKQCNLAYHRKRLKNPKNKQRKNEIDKKYKNKFPEKQNMYINKWKLNNQNYLIKSRKFEYFIKKHNIYHLLINIQNNKCLSCDKKMLLNSTTLKPIVEHWIPRSKNGLDCLDNIYLVCKSCNSKKYNHLPEEFYGNKYNKISEKRLQIIKQLKEQLDYENNRIIFDCLI